MEVIEKETEGMASWRRAMDRLIAAHSRAEAEAATVAWQEHARRYPDFAWTDYYLDPWLPVLAREEQSQQLGLTPQEHEERERLWYHMERSPDYNLPKEHPDLPGNLDRLMALLLDWLRRYPHDESIRGRLRNVYAERRLNDHLFHGGPYVDICDAEGNLCRLPEEDELDSKREERGRASLGSR